MEAADHPEEDMLFCFTWGHRHHHHCCLSEEETWSKYDRGGGSGPSPSSPWHPSIFYTRLIQFRVMGGWSLSQLSLGERQETWTGRQSISAPHRDKQPSTLTLTPRDNLESPINLHHLWMVGGSRSTRREPTLKHGEHADSTQKEPAEIRTRNPLLWGDCATTTLLRSPPMRSSNENHKKL